MDKNFRRLTLLQMAKKAGLLVNMVQQHVAGKGQPVTYETTLNVPGAQIYIPTNAINPRTKTYNVMIHFKSKVDHLAKSGLNTVMVTANEAKGKQFTGQFAESYSKAKRGNFVARVLGTIQNYLQKKVPGTGLGKWGMSAFSGGSGAINKILKERNYPSEPDAIMQFDSMHSSRETQLWAERNNVAGDPSKKLVVVHSAIPTSYTSTTEAAQKLTSAFGMQRTQPATWQQRTEPISPVSESSRGGIHVYQMYDPSSKTDLREQHWAIMRGIGDAMRTHIGEWD